MELVQLSRKRLVAVLVCVALPCGAAVAQGRMGAFVFRIPPAGGVWAPGGWGGYGAVGLRPEVRFVPSGSVLDATATVSHDRRYVTITARPQMSQLQRIQRIEVDLIWGGGNWPVLGGGAPPAPVAPPVALGGKHAEMAARAGLLPQQKDAVAEGLRAKKMAESQWRLANGAQLCQLEYAKAEARGADRARIARQIEALQAEKDEVSADGDRKIMSLLAPRQRAKAHGYLLARALRDELRFLGLRREQTRKIDRICTEATRGCFSAADVTRDGTIRSKCLDEIVRTVLDEAQQRRYAQAKTAAPPAPAPTHP